MRENGVLDIADKHLRRALKIDPNDEEAHVEMGLWYGMQHRLDEAEASLQTALQINPDSPTVHYNLGMARRNRGNDREAATFFLRATSLSEYRFDDAIENYVGCLVRLGESGEAVDFIKDKALDRRPSEGRFWRLLSRVYLKEGDKDAATQAIREGLARSPMHPELTMALAWLLATSSQPSNETVQEAVQLAKYASELAMTQATGDALATLAAAHARAGQYEQAITAMERALQCVKDAGDQNKIRRFETYMGRFKTSQPITLSTRSP
jgi:Tfp pilus assembly protein PilF